jgi:hypothetical protein
MVVVPLTHRERESGVARRYSSPEGTNWARVAAGGGLLVGGLLLLTGNKRAGLVTAGAGTALAMLDQQDAVQACWNALPGYIDAVQRLLTSVEETVVELAEQRNRLHQILTK